MRILVDYRAALRERTGVGEATHELARAYAAAYDDQVVLFTSSWKDRPRPEALAEIDATVVDRRIPVRILNLLWHRASWPPIELLAGAVDVAHSGHPLLMPARRAAQVVTIYDLHFLSHPERTNAEIRRDYPALAATHARRADAIVTSSAYTRDQVSRAFDVEPARIHVCPLGAPSWGQLGRKPNVPDDGYVLFLGTLEPRKNVGVLLDAYASLLDRRVRVPRLVLAGRATPRAQGWLDRLARPPLYGHVEHLGYVEHGARERLYAGARLLVLPSLDEGFGLPALEAMSAGVPVVVSNRGSLPEVVAGAGALVEPEDVGGLAAAIERAVTDATWAERAAWAGLERARAFTWRQAATVLHDAYAAAIARRGAR